MKKIEAINHFGTQERLAEALLVAQSTISGSWGEYPPDARQLQIERITLGALRAEPECMDRLLGMDKVKAAQVSNPVTNTAHDSE
jgi:hypothetical protein